MNKIKIENLVNTPLEKVWEVWTNPEHIKNWCHASDDWGVGEVSNDLINGGRFSTIMRANDGSVSFDFNGIYTNVIPNNTIEYMIEGGREVKIAFQDVGGIVKIEEEFEMENENSEEKQREGWQAILNNFKNYCETIQ